MIEAVLIAIAPALAKLIESATEDEYDQDAELQAILQLQRALADERVRQAR